MVESIIYFKIKIELHAKLSDASRSTLSDLCLFLVPSGVNGIVSAGLMSMVSAGLPGEEDLLEDEEEDTVALDFGNFFLGLSAAFAASILSRLARDCWSSLASFLASSLFALMLSLGVLSLEGLTMALGVDFCFT